MDSVVHNTTIISVLLATDKTVLTKDVKDMAQWLVYLTICNLSYKIRSLWIRLVRIMIGLIPIYKRDFLRVKTEIYHQTIKMFTKGIRKFLIVG